jgi:uncharacterized integral membrane protein (TIGR02327 family)
MRVISNLVLSGQSNLPAFYIVLKGMVNAVDLYVQAAQQAITNIAAYIVFIGISFYALQGLRIEQLFRKGKTFQIQLFYIIMSIVLGATVADFFINFLTWSRTIPFIFN